ncbi:hypothetical protein TEA_014459 [Camellia sinensis var. sinensis]|uniref:Plant bHLH transcription factor ACT-like domain-containing protein n=1 Tax=Camellia sinensis var. sinensis TaxID=542762 RepID=A0A4S4EKS8_CAMSN|nr:hypothetical protein TEA_014459 [Camellia sinensis var. sinensis]
MDLARIDRRRRERILWYWRRIRAHIKLRLIGKLPNLDLLAEDNNHMSGKAAAMVAAAVATLVAVRHLSHGRKEGGGLAAAAAAAAADGGDRESCRGDEAARTENRGGSGLVTAIYAGAGVEKKKKCPGLLVTILKAFEELGLDVLDANVSCSDNFRLEAVGGEEHSVAAFTRVLDEASVVLLFRDKVYLHPDKHIVAVHADVAQRKKRNWADMEPQFEKCGLMDVDQEDLMILVPPLFSIKDVPEKVV